VPSINAPKVKVSRPWKAYGGEIIFLASQRCEGGARQDSRRGNTPSNRRSDGSSLPPMTASSRGQGTAGASKLLEEIPDLDVVCAAGFREAAFFPARLSRHPKSLRPEKFTVYRVANRQNATDAARLASAPATGIEEPAAAHQLTYICRTDSAFATLAPRIRSRFLRGARVDRIALVSEDDESCRAMQLIDETFGNAGF